MSTVEQFSSTLAGVVAVDGGTTGLEGQFGAFLAVILGLFIPVVRSRCAVSNLRRGDLVQVGDCV